MEENVLVIVYYCFAGAHASVVASAIHCGFLPSDRIPNCEEIIKAPYFDNANPNYIGIPSLMGIDERGNKIYFMGMYNQRAEISFLINEIMYIEKINRNEYLFQDTFPIIGLTTKLGGLLSKKCGVTKLGRLLSAWGIKKKYLDFLNVVINVKKCTSDV